MLNSDEEALRAATQTMIIGAIIIAVLWGQVSTRLYVHPEQFSMRSILRPTRHIHYWFIVYLTPLVATLVVALAIPGSINTNPMESAAYLLSGTTYRGVGYSSLFLSLAATIIVAFVGYPFAVLVSLRSELRDKMVRSALRTIATSFGTISALILATNALDNYGISVIGIGNLVAVVLLMVVLNAFGKPSFLKAFLTGSSPVVALPGSRLTDHRILVYSNDEEKLRAISSYINEGVGRKARVVLFFRGEEDLLRERLAHMGVDVRRYLTKGDLRLVGIGSLYQGDGNIDDETALDFCKGLIAETRTVGKDSLRLVIDFGSYFGRPWQKFVDHLTDNRWMTNDHYLDVMMMFQSSVFQGQEGALDLLRSRTSVIELTEAVEAFSRGVGLSHSEIAGKKILLEYDPQSDYDKVVTSLLTESISNFEGAVIFTRRDSPIHNFSAEEQGVKKFILTSKVSYPKMEGQGKFLLPAFDTSLLLDALNRTIEAYAGTPFIVIFDNVSHYVFTVGPDRAQSLVRQSLELMISNKITAVFMLNYEAHDQRTVSTFEGLFDMEVVCRPGDRVPEVRRRLAIIS